MLLQCSEKVWEGEGWKSQERNWHINSFALSSRGSSNRCHKLPEYLLSDSKSAQRLIPLVSLPWCSHRKVVPHFSLQFCSIVFMKMQEGPRVSDKDACWSLEPWLSTGPGFPCYVFLVSQKFQTNLGACLVVASDNFCAFVVCCWFFCSLIYVILCYLGALLPVSNSLNLCVKGAICAKTDLIKRERREGRGSFY